MFARLLQSEVHLNDLGSSAATRRSSKGGADEIMLLRYDPLLMLRMEKEREMNLMKAASQPREAMIDAYLRIRNSRMHLPETILQVSLQTCNKSKSSLLPFSSLLPNLL
jgi:hypothetical protein